MHSAPFPEYIQKESYCDSITLFLYIFLCNCSLFETYRFAFAKSNYFSAEEGAVAAILTNSIAAPLTHFTL